MRLSRIILVLTIGLLITSCTEDNDSIEVDGLELVGEWQGETVNYTGTTTTEIQGVALVSEFEGIGYDVNYVININNDLTQITSNGSYSIELTTSVQGQSFTVNEENLTFEGAGTIILAGDEITFNDGSVGTIVELSANFLELNLYKEQTVTVSGFDSITSIDMTLTYTR